MMEPIKTYNFNTDWPGEGAENGNRGVGENNENDSINGSVEQQNNPKSDKTDDEGLTLLTPSNDNEKINRTLLPIENLEQQISNWALYALKSPILKKSEKSKQELGVRSVRLVRNVRLKISLLTLLPANSLFKSIFAENMLTRTLGLLFFANDPLSYSQIAEILSEAKASLNTKMSQNQQYFLSAGQDASNAKLFVLSPAGLEAVEDIIDLFLQKSLFQGKSLADEEWELRKAEALTSSIQRFVDSVGVQREGFSLNFNVREMAEFDPALSEFLLVNPDKVVTAIREVFDSPGLEVRFYNLPPSCILSVENVRAEHVDKLITLEGRSVSLSTVRPKLKEAKFECPNCGALLTIRADFEKLVAPSRCSCGWRGSFKLISRSIVDGSNVMLEDLQEKTDSVNLQRLRARIEGSYANPRSIQVFAPGNEIRVTGMLREIVFSKGKEIKTDSNLYFEVLHAELFEPEVSLENFSTQEIQQFQELAGKIDAEGLQVIRESFAPEVYGYDAVKDAVALQLCARRNTKQFRKERNMPNILMIGDPGVAKSVLATFAVEITPGARKAMGGTSSGVGITAAAVKEEDDAGGWRVEPGALPLTKQLLFLDELNNMNDEDKPKLQEAMNEQTITINKANLHVTLKVTAGILAAANPIHGVFVLDKDVSEQFNIPVPILNRFDTIFVMKDEVNAQRDRSIAEKMLNREMGEVSSTYPPELLKKFFVFIRSQSEPVFTKELSKFMSDAYAEIRQSHLRRVVPLNPRFLEALRRLMKASAKMRLAKTVEEKDFRRSIEILGQSHYSVDYAKLFFKLEGTQPTGISESASTSSGPEKEKAA